MGLQFKQKYDLSEIKYSKRDARIVDGEGNIIFEQKDVIAPHHWSDQAVSIFASKYFNGKIGSLDREYAVDGVFNRIVKTIKDWGIEDEYFDSKEDSVNFYNDLMYVLLSQMGTFASPFYFNVGIKEEPFCGSCFLNNVEDDIESITDIFKLEARIFKGGGGSGTNLSKIRGSKEGLFGGGYSSGPVSFMKAYDSFGGEMKSGGSRRRSAALRALDVDHPNIMEFISCKVKEERKGKDLLSLGYSGGLDGDAASSLAFQNANLCVRLSDAFMNAVLHGENWALINRVGKNVDDWIPAKDILMAIAESSWECGDPGVQYSDTIERRNPLDHEERPIEVSNPCGEILHANSSQCVLSGADINKVFEKSNAIIENGIIPHNSTFLRELQHIVELFVTAQDISINHSGYPYPEMEYRSKMERPIGFGITNIGGFLMSNGVPYDSDDGRKLIGEIMNSVTYFAFNQSLDIAEEIYPIPDKVVPNILDNLNYFKNSAHCFDSNKWDCLIEKVSEIGIRNSQTTCLQPFGTCGIIQDNDSSGLEPVFSLVKVKNLIGGGIMKTVSSSVKSGLKELGYSDPEIDEIIEYVKENGEIVGAPNMDVTDYKVFQTALSFYPQQCISVDGHIDMLKAIQDNITSGASKTVNLPNNTTVQEIYDLYIDCWKKGLKSIIVYRDGSKTVQPMSTVSSNKNECLPVEESSIIEEYEDIIEELTIQLQERDNPVRKHLPAERSAINHKFNIGGHEGYLNVGLFEDGTPGEIFVTMSKAGSAIAGLVDAFSISISLGLQYGVPLEAMIEKFSHMGFEPSGFTTNPNINVAKSIVDYIFRWMEIKFPKSDETIIIDDERIETTETGKLMINIPNKTNTVKITPIISGDVCVECGGQLIQNGGCKACINCGVSGGCG